MNKHIVILGYLAATLTACVAGGGEGTAVQASTVVLDVRCGADADCPSGFECEEELEHGVTTSYCVSHDEDAAAAGTCPPGFELETEHAETFCKPHGGEGEGGGGKG